MRVWEVSKSNVSVFSQCGHKANNYLEKGPYCISLRQITLVLKGRNYMKDTKDILHTNHWTAPSSIKTAVKGLVFVAHNGVSGYAACSYRIYIYFMAGNILDSDFSQSTLCVTYKWSKGSFSISLSFN